MLDAPRCPCCGDQIAPTVAHPEPPYGHEPMSIVYECDCGTVWSEDWCCACDSNCPVCGETVGASDWNPLKEAE